MIFFFFAIVINEDPTLNIPRFALRASDGRGS
jgi:hypothetical protein